MKIIECLNDKISEELSDSESYANLALKYKESDKETAKLFYDLSLEETKHYNKLHDRVVALINDYKAKNGAPPADMLAVYNYVHGRSIAGPLPSIFSFEH